MQPLRIDHLNYYLGGGAAIAARRVHAGLRAAGHESTFWYLKGDPPPDDSYHVWRPEAAFSPRQWFASVADRLRHAIYKRQLRRALRGRPDGLEPFSPAILPHRRTRTAGAFCGDILHLHWLGPGVDYRAFFAAAPSHKPIVWTLHDMNPLTGGCHYAGNCQAFMRGCGNCPQLGRPSQNDLSALSFQAKRDAIPNAIENLHIVAPSQWLLELAQSSPLLGRAASFQLIRYGIDLNVFRPMNRREARERLGLPQDARIVAFGADDVDNRRKGFQPMCETLRHLAGVQNLLCVYFGRGEMPEDAKGLPTHALGFIKDKTRLAEVYSAADVFVMPSLEDNSPQTGIESISCGTPVAAFQAGGITDYVKPGVTGALAPVGDARALAHEIRAMLQRQSEGKSLRESARDTAVRMFAPATQAKSYELLYHNAMQRHVNAKGSVTSSLTANHGIRLKKSA